MLITAILILVISGIYITVNYKNKFTYVIALFFLSTTMMLVFASLYISKISSYKFSLPIDYQLYLWLSTARIHVWNIARLLNAGFALFMLASVLFVKVLHKIKWVKSLLLILPIILFLIWTDAGTSQSVYLYINTLSDLNKAENISNLSGILNCISVNLIYLYMLMPFLALFNYCLRTQIPLKRRSALTYGISLFFMDCFVHFAILNSSLKYIMTDKAGYLKVPVVVQNYNGYIILPISIAVILLLIIFLTLYFKPFHSYVFIRRKEIMQNQALLDGDLSMLLHIYKNAFLCIDKYTQSSNQTDDVARKDRNNARISSISQQTLDQIQRILNLLRDVRVKYNGVNLSDCMDAALEKACIPPEITVVKRYGQAPVVLADFDHMSEIFLNILSNAIEAVNDKGAVDKRIEIEIGHEVDYVYVNITDNGVGIQKHLLKKVFRPFYTTKPMTSGGGVGLNYVEKVIKKFDGEIFVRSEYGQYTTFQIILPVYEEKLKKIFFKGDKKGNHKNCNL